MCFDTRPPGGSGAHSSRSLCLSSTPSLAWLDWAGTATHRSAVAHAASLECLGTCQGECCPKLRQKLGSPLRCQLGDSKGPRKGPGVALDRSKELRLGVWEAETLFPERLSNKERPSECVSSGEVQLQSISFMWPLVHKQGQSIERA